jgi:hypothetical protein
MTMLSERATDPEQQGAGRAGVGPALPGPARTIGPAAPPEPVRAPGLGLSLVGA